MVGSLPDRKKKKLRHIKRCALKFCQPALVCFFSATTDLGRGEKHGRGKRKWEGEVPDKPQIVLSAFRTSHSNLVSPKVCPIK